MPEPDGEYSPAGQLVQLDFPADEYCPAGQATHEAGLCAYVPAGQLVFVYGQLDCSDSEYLPAGHETQLDCPDDEYVPAEHIIQDAGLCAYVPTGQVVLV